jgi:predicted dienelactone hydrolase
MRIKIPATILLLFCFVSVAASQEIKGVWAGAFEADEVFAAIRLNFDESKIILSFSGSDRSGAIKDLKITGGEISFTAELQPGARFTGKVENEKINGTFDILRRDGSKSGSGVWNARKVDSMNFTDDSPAVSTSEKIELPRPTGKFSIGRQFFYWTDESRAETITEDPNDKRKLFVQIWYPAKKGGKLAAEYYPNVTELRGKSPSNELFATVKTHATTDAKIADSKQKFPVIVFSPGLGSSPFSYAAIIENLVSHGYVVAAINHPYDSGDFKFSDGQIIRFDEGKWNREVSKDWTAEQRKQFFDERRLGWAQDISFVVNQLEKLEKPFAGKLDLQNLGVFGHSFGGQATSIACASDKRFKACANLDGIAQGNVILPDAQGEILKQPFLFFNKSAEVTNAELKMMGLSRAEYRVREQKRLLERWKPSFKTRLAELESGAYFVLYPGIKHSSFSDSLLLATDPKDPLFAERNAVAQNINEYLLAFFDKFLQKKAAPLLDEIALRRQDKAISRPPIVVEFLRKAK